MSQTYAYGGVTTEHTLGGSLENLSSAAIDAINAALQQLVEIRIINRGADSWTYTLSGGAELTVEAGEQLVLPIIDVHDSSQNADAIQVNGTAAETLQITAIGSPKSSGTI